MTRALRFLVGTCAAATLLASIGCGDSSDGGSTSGGGPTGPSPSVPAPVTCPAPYKAGSVSATIDGSRWTSVCAYSVMVSANGTTILSLSGSDLAASQTIIGFGFAADRPGTYTPTSATLTVGSASWVTVSTGTVTLTSLTSTAMAGTFSFTVTGATGTRTVSNGSFNVAF
jgi:hypothetical protein